MSQQHKAGTPVSDASELKESDLEEAAGGVISTGCIPPFPFPEPSDPILTGPIPSPDPFPPDTYAL